VDENACGVENFLRAQTLTLCLDFWWVSVSGLLILINNQQSSAKRNRIKQ